MTRVLFLVWSLAIFSFVAGCDGGADYPPPDPNEAKAALLQVATRQESYYLRNRTYTDDLAELGYTPVQNQDGYSAYSVELAPMSDDALGVGAELFTATATYKHGNPVNIDCQWLKINAFGEKTSGPNSQCWYQ